MGSARHQYGISALVTHASFCEGSSGDLAERRLFSRVSGERGGKKSATRARTGEDTLDRAGSQDFSVSMAEKHCVIITFENTKFSRYPKTTVRVSVLL